MSHLDLDDNQISNIKPLSGLLDLRTLDLDDNYISSIGVLSNLINLHSLYLEDNQISNISALADLNLTHLSLEDNQVQDISPLAGLTRLSHLYAENNGFSDISALAGLDSLRHLDLHENQIRDLSALASLADLEYLDLSINRIEDVAALSGLKKLHTLNLYLNQINDIRPLSQLNRLQRLHLHYNQIVDISPLVHLTGLQLLELHNNPLSQAAYCRDLYGLLNHNPSLDLSYSPQRPVPARVWASHGSYPDQIQVSWSEVCYGPGSTSHYRVFRTHGPDNSKTAISPWQTDLSFTDRAVAAGRQYRYWVQASTDSQGTDAQGFAGPALGWLQPAFSLSLGSTAGGLVTVPGPGTVLYADAASVSVQAVALDPDLYRFSQWTGTAVAAGRVAEPGQAVTLERVDAVYTLQAEFVSTLETLFVDDNASADPGPGDARVSDPLETGTAEHPFDRIQEAIEVARDGSTVIVRAGTYQENIDFLGKSIHVQGLDPNGVGFPVIEGDGHGPVVSFIRQEDLHSRLTGFVITRGCGDLAGGITCEGSSPSISNCLIAGNRALDPYGSAIRCWNSHAALVNCTVADNMGGEYGAGISLLDSDVILKNSIVWGNRPGDILSAGDSVPLIAYCDISDVSGAGNIGVDPLFAQAGFWVSSDNLQVPVGPANAAVVWLSGDYHLRSETGRWHAETQAWLKDANSSLCIDSGDPMTSIGQEPIPHGDVINQGAYGGTVQSSKSVD